MDGFYINLDRSPDRRARMDAQLRRLSLQSVVHRRAAIDGQRIATLPPGCTITAGELACFCSHAEAIAAPGAEAGLRLVLEDDVELAEDLPGIVQGFGLAQLENWDIVFLDCQPHVTTTSMMTLWNSLQVHGRDAASGRVSGANLYEAADFYHWGATAYLVTAAGRARLPALLEAALRAGPQQAFDLWLGRMIQDGRVRAGVVAPFLATPDVEHAAASTIGARSDAADDHSVQQIVRRLFFAGPTDELLARAAAVVGPHSHRYSEDSRLDLLVDLMAREFVAVAERNAGSGVRW